MTNEELQRALSHCHAALGESLSVIDDLLNQNSDPEDIVRRVEDAQKKYTVIGQLFNEKG